MMLCFFLHKRVTELGNILLTPFCHISFSLETASDAVSSINIIANLADTSIKKVLMASSCNILNSSKRFPFFLKWDEASLTTIGILLCLLVPKKKLEVVDKKINEQKFNNRNISKVM